MPEVDLVFPRAWVEFVNPSRPHRGDQGRPHLAHVVLDLPVRTGEMPRHLRRTGPNDGCCTLGAHYADAAATRSGCNSGPAQLTPDDWQFYKRGGKKRVSETDDEGERKTRGSSTGAAASSSTAPASPAGDRGGMRAAHARSAGWEQADHRDQARRLLAVADPPAIPGGRAQRRHQLHRGHDHRVRAPRLGCRWTRLRLVLLVQSRGPRRPRPASTSPTRPSWSP